MKTPRIYAVVGTHQLFEKCSKHLQSGEKLVPGSDIIYGIKLDKRVKRTHLEIRDLHGHTFATFEIKK